MALLLLVSTAAVAQNYTSYFTGNAADAATFPQGGVVLMGGATEEDEAIKWFLNRADGGDVMVLRASGSDGYNDYFYNQLGVSVNSVETIVFNDATAANEAYIQQKIAQAEAIWFAGGDQWDYVSYWQGSPIETAINQAISQGAVVGGTSAGMAILGGVRFTAENGTVTSATALSNPYDANVTLDNSSFISSGSFLSNTITDTHYDNPDRKGRHITFLAKMLTDTGVPISGIACDEYTAVCIDETGLARVYGQSPTYDDNAYFLQSNCELSDPTPEECSSGNPLTWNHNGAAVKVYAVKGTLSGTNTFDLSDWSTGSGGEWQDWSVVNGILSETAGNAPNCTANVDEQIPSSPISVFPNPAEDFIQVNHQEGKPFTVAFFSVNGTLLFQGQEKTGPTSISLQNYSKGVYLIKVITDLGVFTKRVVVR